MVRVVTHGIRRMSSTTTSSSTITNPRCWRLPTWAAAWIGWRVVSTRPDFDEIVDSQNSTLSGKTISTSWVLLPMRAVGTPTCSTSLVRCPQMPAARFLLPAPTPPSRIWRIMGNTPAVSGEVPADVDTRTPSFDLSAGSISGGVGRANDSECQQRYHRRYAWSQSSAMPATRWIPLTSDELAAAQTTGFTAMTRQESGTWYLHVLGICDSNGALVYKSTSVDFSSSGDPDPVQPPSISVSVNNDATGQPAAP